MFCKVNNIKEKYETVKRDNRDIRIESVEIAESEVSYVEDLCHSMLGNMLQFGWQLGEKTDTPAIKLGLLYCGFLGMISKKNRLIEEGKSPEDLFKSICENGFNALDDSINMVLELSSKDREKYNKLFDDISTDTRDFRKANGITCEEFIFSTTEVPFPESVINDYLERYCKRLGIPYRSSHKLRKTAVSSMVNAGISLNAVREFAGHVDETTTLRYYTFDRENEAIRNEQIEKALSFGSDRPVFAKV